MSYKFNWYNLPIEVNKVIEPLSTILNENNYKKVKNIYWYNLPLKLNTIFKILLEEYFNCTSEEYPVKYNSFLWFGLNKKTNILYELINSIIACNDVPEAVLKSFQISQESFSTLGGIDCIISISQTPTFTTAYHNGTGVTPVFLDKIYLDINGTLPYNRGVFITDYVSNTSFRILTLEMLPGNQDTSVVQNRCGR